MGSLSLPSESPETFSKEKQNAMSEKPYSKLHMKIFFTSVQTARAGRTEVMAVAAQNCQGSVKSWKGLKYFSLTQ